MNSVMQQPKKARCAMTLLKAILVISIVFVASRNFSLYNLTAQSIKQFESEARKSFIMDSVKEDFTANDNDGRTMKSNNQIETKIERMSKQSTTTFKLATVPFDKSELPEALQPVINHECCPMLSRPPKRLRCGEVCFTPNACNNTLYPYSTHEEKAFYEVMATSGRDELKLQCNEMNGLMYPPYQWCQQWRTDSIMRLAQERYEESQLRYELDPYAANLPPPGCSIFNNGGGSGSFQHLILFPEAKMAFCGIPKVGITQWLQFLRFTFGAKDYLSSPHIKPEVFAMRFDKMSADTQMQILNDPEWKFVAFLRDPAERLLSAYLDKVSSKQLEREHFKKQHGLNRTLLFDEFLNILSEKPEWCPPNKGKELDMLKGVNWCTNPHWRPQTYSCGLSEFLPRFSFVGSLNFIATQARSILKEVGLWENYGKWYHWHKDRESAGKGRCTSLPPNVAEGEQLFGFQQKPENNARPNNTLRASDTGYGHATDSRSKMDMYYTPEMLEKVKTLYEHDYKLWELINKDELHNGRELAMILSDECKGGR